MSAPTPTRVGKLIETFLAERQMSQKEFADLLGFSAAYLTMLMKARRPLTDTVTEMLVKHTGISRERWHAEETAGQIPRDWHAGTVLSDWQITEARQRGLLAIEPFRPAEDHRLQPASYDLSRGNFVRADGQKGDDSIDLELPRGMSALVYTREKVAVSKRLIARIAPMGHLVANFVQLGFGLHLDPGWNSEPFVHLHNLGSDVFILGADECFASIEFHLLADEPAVQIDPARNAAKNVVLPRPRTDDLEEEIRAAERELQRLHRLRSARMN